MPPFGKLFMTSLILSVLGAGGLVFIVVFMEPTLGPRWLFFFFLTIVTTGVCIPFTFILQRRMAKQPVPASVIIREALWVGIFVDLVAWLQLGRIFSNLIMVILAIGLVLLEFFLRVAEKATFKPDGIQHD